MCGVFLMEQMKIYAWLIGTKINGLYNGKFFDNMVELGLTDEEYVYLKENALAAHYENGKVVYKGLEQIKKRQANEKEQADILQWLADNDWKVNKVVVGEWEQDDARFLDYKQQRAIKRKRLDEIEKEML
jgi:hypothetical protein